MEIVAIEKQRYVVFRAHLDERVLIGSRHYLQT